jgi:hypothetical protein
MLKPNFDEEFWELLPLMVENNYDGVTAILIRYGISVPQTPVALNSWLEIVSPEATRVTPETSRVEIATIFLRQIYKNFAKINPFFLPGILRYVEIRKDNANSLARVETRRNLIVQKVKMAIANNR